MTVLVEGKILTSRILKHLKEYITRNIVLQWVSTSEIAVSTVQCETVPWLPRHRRIYQCASLRRDVSNTTFLNG